VGHAPFLDEPRFDAVHLEKALAPGFTVGLNLAVLHGACEHPLIRGIFLTENTMKRSHQFGLTHPAIPIRIRLGMSASTLLLFGGFNDGDFGDSVGTVFPETDVYPCGVPADAYRHVLSWPQVAMVRSLNIAEKSSTGHCLQGKSDADSRVSDLDLSVVAHGIERWPQGEAEILQHGIVEAGQVRRCCFQDSTALGYGRGDAALRNQPECG